MNLSAPHDLGLRRSAQNCLLRLPFTHFAAILLMALLGASALGYAQDVKPAAANIKARVKHVHVMQRSSALPDSSEMRRPFTPRPTAQPDVKANNTGSGVVYTCDPTVTTATCNYLNTTVAGYYSSTFTNANTSIYITFGTTGLGQSEGNYNFVTYDQYVSALTANTNKSAVQTSALSALNTYDATPYGSDYVDITNALANALGLAADAGGLGGLTPTGAECTYGAAGCYDAIITVTNTPDTFYYDNLGGSESSDEYDFYGVVQHETDEVLGTSSCIDTQVNPLADDCDGSVPSGTPTGTPSAVDLFRYSSAGELVLDSSFSTTPGAYFSYNGGSTNGALGVGGTPKVYNTLDNGDDYADYVSSSPDCGTDEAIQDAEGCPGEDAGLTILNDGKSEIAILNAVGYDVPATNTAATMTSPTPSSTLTGPNVTFTWTAESGATEYYLWLGSTGVGSSNLKNLGITSGDSVAVTGLPINGETIYARLWTSYNGSKVYNDYTYTATKQAAITSPAPSGTLPGPNVTFTWSAATGATEYYLWLGSTGVGSSNLKNLGITSGNSVAVTGLPINGETIYARLWTSYSGVKEYFDYTYTASTPAAMTSPTPSSTLPGPNVTFTWSAASGATEYYLWLGSTGVGSSNLKNQGITSGTSVAVTGLPINGETIYARLWTSYSGVKEYFDYTYTAATPASMTSPAPSSTLSGANVTFSWTAAAGATEYYLWLGSTGAGSSNLKNLGITSGTSAAVTGLPVNGETIYARLWTSWNGDKVYTDYTYTAQ